MTRHAAILGAGLAGLTAARYLRTHGFDVTVFEAGPEIAGLAKSHRDLDGFTYDFGAHFITNRLAAAIGASDACRVVRRYGESVFLSGKFCSYPWGMLASPRFVASALAARTQGLLSRRKPVTAAEWFRATYGQALADRIAIPLAEAWSGLPANELSATVGEKIPASLSQTIWLKLAGKIARRAIAIGYCGTLPQSASVWHVYPEGGLGTLCERLAAPLGSCIQTRSPVETICVENERVVGVRVAGQDIPADVVISTAPVHVLPKLVQGSSQLNYLRRFRYRAMTFVNLRLRGRGLLPDVVVWTPDKEFPFFRLTETPLSMPWLAPEGWTLITADLGCSVGDETWTASEEQLAEKCLAGLEQIVPDIRQRYDGCRVLRTPLAYPVYAQEYEADRERFAKGTGIQGLFSVGRNGEFRHILMEDVYWRTRRTLAPLVREEQKEDAVSFEAACETIRS